MTVQVMAMPNENKRCTRMKTEQGLLYLREKRPKPVYDMYDKKDRELVCLSATPKQKFIEGATSIMRGNR